MSLLFVLGAPFIPNNRDAAIPHYVVPALGTSMLGIGTIYWVIWAKLLPLMGFHIQHEIVQMPDGSERVKYKVSCSAQCHRRIWGAEKLTEYATNSA
jgi:phosphatidylinositol 4-kinase B